MQSNETIASRVIENKYAEFVFSLLSGASLAFNLFRSFIVPEQQRSNLILLAIAAALSLLLLNLCFKNRITTIVTLSAACLGLAAACYWTLKRLYYIRSLQVETFVPYLFYVITFLSMLMVFFAARSRAGLILLLLGGCAAFFSLTLQGYVMSSSAYFLFLISSLILLLRKLYLSRSKRFEAINTGMPAFTAAAAIMTVTALILSQIAYGVARKIPQPDFLAVNNLQLNTVGTTGTVGFSAYSSDKRLGGKTLPDNTLVLEVKADEPFYLKGQTYDDYTGSSWRSSVKSIIPSSISYNGINPESVGFWMQGSAFINNPDITNFSKLNTLKKAYPNLKTIISVGGWTYSAGFSNMALTASSRQVFVQSCIDFIKAYGFDGIDIDWEYPVSGGQTAGRPEDKTNFTLLMRDLRTALDAREASDGRQYYLSFAGGAGGSFIKNTELASLGGIVDYALIMTYDLHGPWDAYSDFNAPLYTPAAPSPQYKISTDSAVQSWLTAGFPAGKLTLGVPFYGYVYSGVSSANYGLYQTFTSAKAVGYDSIVANYLSNAAFARFFQSDAQVPWLFGNSTFISYDDPNSVAQKAAYARSKGLKGVSAWELDFDKSCALLGPIYSGIH